MSFRPWQTRIMDILASIHTIQQFTEGMDHLSFVSDPKTIRAVAFELTTMGEAARAIPSEIIHRYADIPWRKMLDIRNIIIHEYFRVDEEILWNTVQDDLPPLIPQLEEILKHNK